MRLTFIGAALTLLAAPLSAHAALSVGAKAPEFRTQGALGGKTFTFTLKRELRKGPLVLYFFPAAFTQGCTLEANAFAQATEDFRKEGATVVGMSADPIDKLADFSVKECRNKFAVASASPAVVEAYDVKLPPIASMPQLAGKTDRTSYVIAPDGRVIYVHSDRDYRDHVKNTLAAVREWRAANRASKR